MIAILRYLFIFLFTVLLASCSVERKLGKEYLKRYHTQSVMLIPANFLYRYNSGAVVDTLAYKSPEIQDSIAFEQSVFLKNISDSLFLERFTNSLINGLSQQGYDVILDASADIFFSRPHPAWIIDLKQLQLEENYSIAYLYTDTENEYRQVPYKLFSVSLNAWIETSPVNNSETRKQLLFAGMGIEESVKTVYNFSLFTGEFLPSYSFDPIRLNDVYRMASRSGQIHAQMLFDYFINDYIRRNMPKGSAARTTLHYNPKSRSLSATPVDRYDVVR